MSKMSPEWVTVRNKGAEAALILIHGFSGCPEVTFGRLPEILCEEGRLADWDVYALGYPTQLAPDFSGIWTGDPDISTLATLLRTRLGASDFRSYKALGLVAHSMGGLVAQRALLDDEELHSRISHLFLFGTPSKGLYKATLTWWLKRQLRDMSATGKFIRTLRRQWTSRVEERGRPKVFVVAGDRDEFVPVQSSLGPFPMAQRYVVHGNHLQIMKPESADHLSVKVLVEGLTAGSVPGGPLSAARLAIEMLEFQAAVDHFWPYRDELDDDHLVLLALALESLGRSEEALEMLDRSEDLGTDAQGVLAGRLKRRWHVTGRKADSIKAMELYRDAYEQSVEVENHAQAFYHGINVAYLLLAARKHGKEAEKWAERVLGHCELSPEDAWCFATQAEAALHLGDLEAAVTNFGRALEFGPSPRQVQSMAEQAFRVAVLRRHDRVIPQLEALFRGAQP